MIYIGSELCWSPLPPERYGSKMKNGRYYSPVGYALNYSLGLNGDLLKLIYGDDYECPYGIYNWNITWLLYPDVDKLPEAVRVADATGATEHFKYLKGLVTLKHPDELGPLMSFAEEYKKELQGDPLAFLAKMRSYGYKNLQGVEFDVLKARALTVMPEESSKVTYVQFGRKAA